MLRSGKEVIRRWRRKRRTENIWNMEGKRGDEVGRRTMAEVLEKERDGGGGRIVWRKKNKGKKNKEDEE